MQQLSLFTSYGLAGVIPSIRAAMRCVAGAEESEGRKQILSKMNDLARQEGIRLTGGNVKIISMDTFNKWLSPSDFSHVPSMLAIITFCKVTGDHSPLLPIAQSIGLSLMTVEDKKLRDYGLSTIKSKKTRQQMKRLEDELL